MSLDPSTVIYQFDSGPYFDEEEAVIQLLREGVLNIGGGDTVTVFVNSSDVFMWACADGDDLPYDEIEPLYRLVLAYGIAGKEKWLCLRRNSKPQACVARDMKKVEGVWDDVMEALPENGYDQWCQEQAAKRVEGAK